ncbi:peptidoglycan-associated lipoprotein Pal [Rhodoferax lacus]|uniref:Peptidoglycan-associated lipoprotein n=1 Tax=Rhodoferax lacus TaxID=2184758 RepID=A0A3E1RGZ7_9BURK|nr:peptidoglycan-associated lipoprotein Pal [Rhodoferax lacus]RFO98665.1 peptidoglycan-associated lipoprotein Pal [Rhodoferax lacus]
MKRTLVVVGLVAVLSACGSAVKLDNVPVEDRSGSSSGSAGAGGAASGSAVGKGAVASVDLTKSGQDAAMQATTRVVYFDYDSFAVRSEFQAVIESHAKYIRADKSRKVVIEGHTDERGGREYNIALGQKRAEAVRKALSLLGVAESQLEAVSFGKEKPAVQGSSEAVMEKNRRAEISYR